MGDTSHHTRWRVAFARWQQRHVVAPRRGGEHATQPSKRRRNGAPDSCPRIPVLYHQSTINVTLCPNDLPTHCLWTYCLAINVSVDLQLLNIADWRIVHRSQNIIFMLFMFSRMLESLYLLKYSRIHYYTEPLNIKHL